MKIYAWAHTADGYYPEIRDAWTGKVSNPERAGRIYIPGDLVTAWGFTIVTDDRTEAESYQPAATDIVELEQLPHPLVTIKEWRARHILSLCGGAVLDHLPMDWGIRGGFAWAKNQDAIPLSEFGTAADAEAARRRGEI